MHDDQQQPQQAATMSVAVPTSPAPADSTRTGASPVPASPAASEVQGRPSAISDDQMYLVNAAGELRVVPRAWTADDREQELTHALSTIVGQHVALDAPGDVPHHGCLRVVRGPLAVMLRLSGGDMDRQGRVCLTITAEHHEAIEAHRARGGAAYQLCTTRILPTTHRAAHGAPPADGAAAQDAGEACAITVGQLVTLAVPYERLSPIVGHKLRQRSRHRINIGLLVEPTPTGARLTLSGGGGIDVTEYADLSDLATLLRTQQLEPWARIDSHARLLGVVGAVLTRRDGLHSTVCPLDARRGVDQRPLAAVGAPPLMPHRLPRAPRTHVDVDTLLRTDLIGTPEAAPLLEAGDQPLTLVEVELTTSDPLEKLARRVWAAERLGLTVGECLVVAAEDRLAGFARRLPILRTEVARRVRMVSIRQMYEAYRALADAHALQTLEAETRAN